MIESKYCELSGQIAPLELGQDLWTGLTFFALFVVLVLVRFVNLLLTTTQNKGEPPMKNNGKKEKLNLLAASTLETVWASGVSYTVASAMAPIVHN